MSRFRENIKLEVLHVTKEELLDDFDNAGDITRNGFAGGVLITPTQLKRPDCTA